MKKVRNFFIIFTLLVIRVNNAYATVSGNYTVSKTKNNGKILFLLIGLVLIGMVLFLGYKMDKFEENSARKKRINKSENNKEKIKKHLDNIISKIKEIIEKKKIKEEKEIQTFVYDELENKDEIQEGGISNERDIIEYDDDDLVIDNISYSKNFVENEKQAENSKNIEPSEPIIHNTELDAISNIFNQEIKKDDLNIKVKGYDFNIDDDIELLDIEESIKEANIKKYTRKKDKIEKKDKKENKNVLKHYTRKIESNQNAEILAEKELENNNKNKPKRYTRKIKNEENENYIEEKVLEDNNGQNNKLGSNSSNIENNNENDEPDDMNFLNKIVDLGILEDIEELEDKINKNRIDSNQTEIHNSDITDSEPKIEKNKDIEIKKENKLKQNNEEDDLKSLLNLDSKKGKEKKTVSKKTSKTEKDNKTVSKKKESKENKSQKEEKNKTKKDKSTEKNKEKTKAKKSDITPVKRGRKPKVLSEEEELRQAIEMLPKSRRGRKPKK